MRPTPSALFRLAPGVLLGGTLVYWWWLKSVQPLFADAWSRLLIPDLLLLEWVGNDPSRFTILDRVPVLGLAAALIGIAWLIGNSILRSAGIQETHSRWENIPLACGIGLHGLSLMTLLCGLVGGLSWLPYLVVIAAALAGWTGLRTRIPSPTTPPRQVGSRWWWLALPFVGVLFAGALLPPWEFDVREYHLQAPKEWFQQGRITFLPHNVYAQMPLAAEMHALLAMTCCFGPRAWWWGAIVGKTVMAAYVPLTALGLYFGVKRLRSERAGAIAAVLFLSTPWSVHAAITGFNEPAVACGFLLGLVALQRWQADNDRRFVPIAGFFAGAAVAAKYTSLVLVWLPLFAVTLLLLRRDPKRLVVGFLLATVVACGPWFVKNWVQTGNPTYPLLYSVFGGASRTDAKDEQWRRAHQVPVDPETGRQYSWRQAVESARLLLGESRWSNPLFVPLLIAALIGAALGKLPRVPWRVVLFLLAMPIAVWWLTTHRVDRFLLPILPLIAALAGIGADLGEDVLWRRVSAGLIGIGLVICFVTETSRYCGDNRYFVSYAELWRDEPHVNDPDYSRLAAHHRWLNDTLGPGDRVLLVGDAQPFDLEVPVLYSTCFDDTLLEELFRGRSTAERRAALRERGITHIFVHWSEIARYRATYGFSDFVQPNLFRDESLPRRQDWGGAELFEVGGAPTEAVRQK